MREPEILKKGLKVGGQLALFGFTGRLCGVVRHPRNRELEQIGVE